MLLFFQIFKKTIGIIRREKLSRVALIILLVILAGSCFFAWFEKTSFPDSLWWSFVTLTTVGYGDISPVTTGGRVVGVTIMIFGIGFLGVFTATIAGIFIEDKIMENKGMKPTDFSNHFLICGWNFRGMEILAELRADPKCKDAQVVVIADVPEKPVDDPQLHFIRGEISAEQLKKANIEEAKVVIVLSDDRLDTYNRDAKTILNILSIKHMNRSVYTCVELMNAGNLDHCRMAGADEIIVVGELSTNLLVQAALNHGITRMIIELVSNRYGEELYKIDIPGSLMGKPFIEALLELKKEHNILCIGIEDKGGQKFIANPDSDYITKPGDQIIVIAKDRPFIAEPD